jgi:bifunctional oligoribonuclease and PAP phosphatase NrnA
MWHAIKSLIADHQQFLLTTHAPPDGDGIGSAIALAELLIAMGKGARIVCDAPLPSRFAFLDTRGLYQQGVGEGDAIIALDTHKLERLGRVAELAKERPIAFIDHHPGKGGPLTVIDPEACAVGAMIYTLFKECGYPLSLAAANGIYTSVICDTGRFSYSSTSRKAHKLADECIKIGVDPDAMHRRLFQQIPFPYLALFGAALQRTERHGTTLIQTVLREDYEPVGIDPDDLDYLHELNKSVAGIECAILLRVLPDDTVRVSFRTTAAINAAQLAAHFGGDGHDRAAGALADGPVKEVKKQLLALLQ